MARNPLSVTLVPAPTATQLAKAESIVAKAKVTDKVNKALDKMEFVFTDASGNSVTLTARATRAELDALRSYASSLRVIEDTPENRKKFKADVAAAVKRYEKNPEKFVKGNPANRKFSQFVGGAAKAQAEAGVPFSVIAQQYKFVNQMVADKQDLLDWMIEQAVASLKKPVKA